MATLVALVSALAGCAAHAGTAAPPAAPGDAVVKWVIDGDTVDVTIEGRVERVRLLGIDTPESVKPDTPVQCFALEASARTKELVPPGTPVKLVRDVSTRDDYGRLLIYLYRAADGLFVNQSLVADGYAVTFAYPPNMAHADELAAAARAARDSGRGLWGACPAESIPHHGKGP